MTFSPILCHHTKQGSGIITVNYSWNSLQDTDSLEELDFRKLKVKKEDKNKDAIGISPNWHLVTLNSKYDPSPSQFAINPNTMKLK
jgi:hypothetical protein